MTKTKKNDLMKSKPAEGKRKRELLRLRKMTPEERVKALVKLNARLKMIFFAGLNRQGGDRKSSPAWGRQNEERRFFEGTWNLIPMSTK